jgi:hypothetical protein
VIGYLVWMATDTTAWRDCYAVATRGASFAEEGHSGSAVVTDDGVIGIVVGGAEAIQGSPSALTYVQDIDAIASELVERRF